MFEFVALHFEMLALETENLGPVQMSMGHALSISSLLNYNIEVLI
jgi:hypothetical protein